MWAWSNSDAAWYFYAPTLAANGSLPGYIQSKGYLKFGTLTASTGLGFWLNSNINAIAASCGNSRITVSWTAVPGATSYNVYRSTSPGTTGTLIGTSSGTSFADTNGTVGTAYYYTVAAGN